MKLKAVKLRLCDEDREKYGGDEWVRFDPDALDDVPWQTQHEWELALNNSIDFILRVEWPAQMARGKASAVWLARMMAGVETPDLADFRIKTSKNKLQIVEDASEGDAVPPVDAEPPSSTAGRSKKESR